MPIYPNVSYSDPALGEIAQNMFIAMRGDPEARAKGQYYQAEMQKSQADAALAQAKADRLGISTGQFKLLPDIFSAERGTMTAPPPPISTDGGMPVDLTPPTLVAPSGDELQRLHARELQAYMGENTNAAEAAKAALSITARPFFLGSPDDVRRASAMEGHPFTEKDVVNYGEVQQNQQAESDKAARTENIKGGYDVTREGMIQRNENWRAQLPKPINTPANTLTSVPLYQKGFYGGVNPQGQIVGLPTKEGVQGAAGLSILQGGDTPANRYVFDPAAARPGKLRTTPIKQAEVDKIRLDALATVQGAVTQQGTKQFINQEFATAVGADRMRAGEDALNDALRNSATPAEAAQAYLQAAGLTKSSFTSPYFFNQFGGLKDNQPPASVAEQSQGAPTGRTPSEVARTGTMQTQGGPVKVFMMRDGSVVDAQGKPVGAQPAAPAQPPAPAAAAPVQTEASVGGGGGIFSAQALTPPTQQQPAPLPETAQVFTPITSDAQAQKAMSDPYRRGEAEEYVRQHPKVEPLPDFAKMSPSEIVRFRDNPGTSPEAKRAAVAYLAHAPTPVKITPPPPLKTQITSQKQADLVLANPRLYANMVPDAKAWNANRYGGQ